MISGYWTSYGVDTALTNNKSGHRLLKTYFGGDLFRNINLKQFDALFEKLNFKAMDDIDALKIALFYFADRVLNGRKGHCQINFDWLNEVDDINYFRNCPWDSLDNALYEKDKKFKTIWLENPNHKIEKYNIYGFTFGVRVHCFFSNKFCNIKYLVVVLIAFSLLLLQAWIYETIGGLPLA